MRTMYILRTDDRPRILENFERPYNLGNGSSDPPSCLVLVGFSRSVDRMALLPVGPNPSWPPFWKISNDHISGMGYLILFHELESSSLGGI